MKKILLVVLGLTALGGLAYALSTTNLLQGNLELQTQEKTLNAVNEVVDPTAIADPKTTDTDGDALPDAQETTCGSNPESKDTDGDGLGDYAECQTHKTDPKNPDTDKDGLGDYAEAITHKTNPNNPDTDAEGLGDYAEAITHKTNPLDKDTDDDTLNDFVEAIQLKTNPLEADSDNGSVQDGVEVENKTDPLDPSDDVQKNDQGSTITCSELSWDPSTITIQSESELTDGLEYTVNISLAMEAGITGTWEGTLHFESTGSGSFSDQDISVTNQKTNISVVYTGGAVGDTLTAVIKEETNCTATTTIAQASTQGTNTTAKWVCESLNISPDSYELSSTESSMDFTVTVEGSVMTSWFDILKNIMTFSLVGGQDKTDELGILVVETDGDGSLSNDKNAETGTSMLIPLKNTSATIAATYSTPLAGETIYAHIKGQENLCTDSLTLSTKTEAQTQSSTSTSSTSSSSTTSSSSSTSTTTSTTLEAESLAEDADEIIGDADYVCTHPFTDIEAGAWYEDLACRMYQANVFHGKSSTKLDPSAFLTNAEAIKVLDILAGYTSDDASGLSTDYLDVSSSKWYYPYVLIAEWKGVARTRDMGPYFNPDHPITRGWYLLYAVRMAGMTLTDWDASDIPASDLDINDPYTYAFIIGRNTIVTTPEDGETPIIEGYSNGTMQPDSFITRSEAMAIAQRVYLAWFSDQDVLSTN